MQIITTIADEGSTLIVTVAFQDEDGTPTAPKTLRWSWVDKFGNPINSLEDVVVSTLTESVDIVLSGDDLQILETEAAFMYVDRRFIAKATYDSDLGSNLPVNGSAAIRLENLLNVG